MSSAVRVLQSHLNICYSKTSTTPGHVGVLPKNIAVDGNFGPGTETALKSVQAHHGISADGQYGPQTRRTILFFADEGFRIRCVRYGA